MTSLELENYYFDFLKADLKALPEKVTTLFDIAGFPHYETVISNFYGFYFDPNAKHQFGDLFISALVEVLKAKTKRTDFITNIANCFITREFYTDNGKYIDIVISEASENKDIVDNAIIIENKIYASVYNDLQEYYNSVKVIHNKIGVVLSLRPEKNLPSNFISITHNELLRQVEFSSGSYFLNVDTKEIIILKEFIQNIKAMTQTTDLKEYYDFFFKHKEKVMEAADLFSTIKADIFKQVNDCCEKLNLGLKLGAQYNSVLRYYFSQNNLVYFTIWLDNIFNGEGDVQIFIELNEEGMDYLNEINSIDFTEQEKAFIKETSKVRKTYVHYAIGVFNPSNEDLKNFTDFIYHKIVDTPLQSLFLKIERVINDKKQGSS